MYMAFSLAWLKKTKTSAGSSMSRQPSMPSLYLGLYLQPNCYQIKMMYYSRFRDQHWIVWDSDWLVQMKAPLIVVSYWCSPLEYLRSTMTLLIMPGHWNWFGTMALLIMTGHWNLNVIIIIILGWIDEFIILLVHTTFLTKSCHLICT